jgi:hypothetical protein
MNNVIKQPLNGFGYSNLNLIFMMKSDNKGTLE